MYEISLLNMVILYSLYNIVFITKFKVPTYEKYYKKDTIR